MLTRLITFVSLLSGLWAGPAVSHEFWIEPERFQVETGAPLSAQLRNGERFKGSAVPYFPERTARFELIRDGEVTPVGGRTGDIPALETVADGDGLAVILHETGPTLLTYQTWEKFAGFAEHKGFADIRARHEARGLPMENFKETYRRFAKALVAVGDGEGSDSDMGMETEFVSLSDPYDPNFEQNFKSRLLYQGAPRADAQVEIFDRSPEGEVVTTTARTDRDGVVSVPVTPGHDYLLDAVVLREAEGEAVWETLWASLTFGVPD